MEQTTNFATELLHELKAQSKRWFVAFCIMVVLELLTIAGFMWYISLPVEDVVTTQTVEDTDNSTVSQVIGGDNNEGDTNSAKDEKGNTQ